MTTLRYTQQLIAAQDEQLRRLQAEIGRLRHVRCCGSWETGMVQMNDDGGTGTGFSMTPGQTVGEALADVDARFHAEGGERLKVPMRAERD